MQKLPPRIKKIILLSTAGAVLLGILSLFGLVAAIRMGMFGRLPSEDDLQNIRNHEASRVFSKEGVLLGTYFHQNRSNVAYVQIAENTVNALIATEDARFMQHEGVDFYAMLRVLVKSLLLGDDSAGGGSTISQQLAKNLFGRSFRYGKLSMPVNKIKEMATASQLEEIYSKEEILALYLNTVSFGENVYGIENAALRYFSKNCTDLTVDESAVLIGILKANTYYNPKLNPENSLQRRNVVLGQMNKYGYLSDDEFEEFLSLPLGLKYKSTSEYLKENGYFLQHVQHEALQLIEEYNKENDTEYDLYTDGLQIETTMHKAFQDIMLESYLSHMRKMQAILNRELRNTAFWAQNTALLSSWAKKNHISADLMKEKANRLLPYFENDTVMELSVRDSLKYALSRLQSSVLAADPHSGAVRVWIGGVNFQLQPFDRVKSKRQVGSTFKPIVYYTALERGLNPCKYISNKQREYIRYDNWSPHNADGNYEGYYSVKGALTNSVNTVTAEVLFKAGIKRVVRTAHSLGIESDIPEVPSIALGTASISLREMVQAYCSFASMGKRQNLYMIERIKTKDGKTIYSHKAEPPEQILDEDIVTELVDMMQSVIDNGTGKRIRSSYGIRSDVAGKTGTTQNNTDAWFIGYTPNLVMGVWAGLDNPAVHFQTTANGQGAAAALPIWAKAFKKIEQGPLAEEYCGAFPFESPDYMDCELYRLDKPGVFESLFGKRKRTRDVQNDDDEEEDNETQPTNKKRKRFRLFGK